MEETNSLIEFAKSEIKDSKNHYKIIKNRYDGNFKKRQKLVMKYRIRSLRRSLWVLRIGKILIWLKIFKEGE